MSMRPIPRTLFVLLTLAVWSILGAHHATAQRPAHVYLTWQGDTGTTMTVNFHTLEGTQSSTVLYDIESRGGDAGAYSFRAEGRKHQIPGVADGRWVHWVELTDLTPDETYYFIAGDSLSGFTDERRFRTVPHGDAPIRFVTGGDLGVGQDVRALHAHAAQWEPLFAVIGGDLAYVNGDVSRVDLWDEWLDMWEDEMVTPEGYTVPFVTAAGNHEVQGGYNGGPERAPFYFGLFAQNGETSYFRRQFGDLLALYVLDSGHVVAHDGPQAAWLEEQLSADQEMPYRFAVYHVPLYPSHRSYDGTYSELGRAHWAPLFDRYRLTTALENHDHTFKRTHRIQQGAVASGETEGTLYLGDGAWGRPPRDIDLSPRWYLDKAGTQQHVWVVDVSPDEVTYRAFDITGRVIDVYPADTDGAAEADTYFHTLPQNYAFDPNSVTVEALIAETTFSQETVRVHLLNVEEYPAEIDLAVNVQSPLTASPEERSVSLQPGESTSLSFALAAASPVAPDGIPPAFLETRFLYTLPEGKVRNDRRFNLGVEERMGAQPAPVGLEVDGRLDEWESLPVAFDQPAVSRPFEEHFTTEIDDWRGPSDSSIRFAVAHDQDRIYIAMDVTDDQLFVDPAARPWDDSDESLPHDGVAIWLDPYPGGDGDDEPMLVVSPGPDGEPVRFAAGDSDDDDLPDGLQVAGTRTPNGYVIEIAVPVAHLRVDGSAPEAVRLNLAISDMDDPDQKPRYYFWRPGWESDGDFAWSGLFRLEQGD